MVSYNEASEELKRYFQEMDDLCNWHKEMLAKYEGDIMEQSVYDVEQGRKFVDTWEAINRIHPKDKNLICLHQIHRPAEIIEIFSEDVKRKETLKKMNYDAKKRLKKEMGL